MIDQALVDQIASEIRSLETQYQLSQGLILTEDDLKCHLFSRISTLVNLSQHTVDPSVLGSPIHSEVKFFDEHGKLTLIPDLTIIRPENLSIFHSVEFSVKAGGIVQYEPYSTKSFEIGGDAIIIELKFCRSKSGLSNKNIQSYQSDIDKISRLQSIVNNRSQGRDRLHGIFAVFNKTNKGLQKFIALELANSNVLDIELIYCTGNVDFSLSRHLGSHSGYLTEPVRIC